MSTLGYPRVSTKKSTHSVQPFGRPEGYMYEWTLFYYIDSLDRDEYIIDISSDISAKYRC